MWYGQIFDENSAPSQYSLRSNANAKETDNPRSSAKTDINYLGLLLLYFTMISQKYFVCNFYWKP